MNDCIFCKIIKGEIPSQKAWEDDDFVIFADISKLAKVHYLLVPKNHYPNLASQSEQDAQKLAKMLNKLPKIVEEVLGVKNGFRIVINQGADAGQTVFHLHIHILGGEKLANNFGA